MKSTGRIVVREKDVPRDPESTQLTFGDRRPSGRRVTISDAVPRCIEIAVNAVLVLG